MPLVEALRRIPAVADHSGRALVVRMPAEELRGHLPVEDHEYPVGHLFSIAGVCSRRPERLTALLRVVESVERGSRPTAARRDLVRGMTTLELWSPETRAELFALLSGVVVPDIEHVHLVVGGSPAARVRTELAVRLHRRADRQAAAPGCRPSCTRRTGRSGRAPRPPRTGRSPARCSSSGARGWRVTRTGCGTGAGSTSRAVGTRCAARTSSATWTR
ncbi:effector-associated domain 2-containing protein [Saccharothrix yanglingensis]|nr:hypothetical protein [Saccharothrix yanglingensis]